MESPSPFIVQRTRHYSISNILNKNKCEKWRNVNCAKGNNNRIILFCKTMHFLMLKKCSMKTYSNTGIRHNQSLVRLLKLLPLISLQCTYPLISGLKGECHKIFGHRLYSSIKPTKVPD
jgi:hypothetical protein